MTKYIVYSLQYTNWPKESQVGLGMDLVPVLERQKQKDLSEFETGLVNMANLGPIRAT